MGSTVKPLVCSKVNTNFHHSEFDKGSTSLSWGLVVIGTYVLLVTCIALIYILKSAHNIYFFVIRILGKVSVD